MRIYYDDNSQAWKPYTPFASLDFESEEDLEFMKEACRTLGKIKIMNYRNLDELLKDILEIIESGIWPNHKGGNLARELKEKIKESLEKSTKNP